MKLTFTKLAGKYDRLTILSRGRSEPIECPKQRIIPHDMVHYAVEHTLRRRGFLGRVHDGEAASFNMGAEAESDGVERLVEVFQGDAWSGGESDPAQMIDLYRTTCRARECPVLTLSEDDILAVRERMAELDRQWQALPVGQSLALDFD